MRFVTGLGLSLALSTACSGGNQYITESDFDKKQDTAATDTAEVEDTGEVDTDTEDTGTNDTDTNDTEETDTEDTNTQGLCTNEYHPVNASGWSKTFNATYDGGSGTATEEGMPMSSYQGRDVYQYRDTMSVMVDNILGQPEEKGWNQVVYVSCVDEDGMYLLGWDGVIINDGFDFQTFQNYDSDISLNFGDGHKYLPYEFAVGAIGSWNNSYTLTITKTDPTSGAQTNTRSISSVHNESPMVSNYQLFDGSTVEAYKTVYEMTITDDLGQTEQNYVEQHWVRGLGLVQEDFIDAQGNVVLSKTLSAYSGLNVIE